VDILCLDLEGVLIPEIWVGVAERTGIEALRKTTRDIPVYDDLMRLRLAVLAEHDIGMDTIAGVIAELEPLDGAVEFLAWARERFQVAVVSDTFYEFAAPMMRKLGSPLLLCHRLTVAEGRITGYQLRQTDPKRHAVRAFQSMNYRVFAAGDSFNDIPMLEQADAACFYGAPANVRSHYPQFPCAQDYAELERLLTDASTV
jgi:phosphoserine / homoserine phosphotransferase